MKNTLITVAVVAVLLLAGGSPIIFERMRQQEFLDRLQESRENNPQDCRPSVRDAIAALHERWGQFRVRCEKGSAVDLRLPVKSSLASQWIHAFRNDPSIFEVDAKELGKPADGDWLRPANGLQQYWNGIPIHEAHLHGGQTFDRNRKPTDYFVESSLARLAHWNLNSKPTTPSKEAELVAVNAYYASNPGVKILSHKSKLEVDIGYGTKCGTTEAPRLVWRVLVVGEPDRYHNNREMYCPVDAISGKPCVPNCDDRQMESLDFTRGGPSQGI